MVLPHGWIFFVNCTAYAWLPVVLRRGVVNAQRQELDALSFGLRPQVLGCGL
jgi:hypothetical protein